MIVPIVAAIDNDRIIIIAVGLSAKVKYASAPSHVVIGLAFILFSLSSY
jgi:hypothetical protein